MSMVMSEDRLRETDEAARALNAYNARVTEAVDAVIYRIAFGAACIVTGGIFGLFALDWLL